MAKITWTEAPQSVIHTAEELIREFHPALQEARIAFVMRSESQKRGPRYILGSTCKVPAKMQPYLEFDFLIWFSEKDYLGMMDEQQTALIDHELCHCAPNLATGGWKLVEHDIQDFAVIIGRYGMWTKDLERIDRAFETYRQEHLPGDGTQISFEHNGRVATISGEKLEKLAESMSEEINAGNA